jgi:hypothetical protein
MKIRVAVAAGVFCAVVIVTGAADGSPLSRTRTQEAYALAYDLQFEECYRVLAEAVSADPLDAAPRRAIAAVTWIEMLFAQGVATFEAFTGELSKGDIARPPAPPQLASRFHSAIRQARALADQQLGRGDTADAQYQVGASAAVAALYQATVEGRALGAFTDGRRAVSALERARGHDAGHHEAALVLGMSAYTVSTMSWPVRMVAKVSGLSANRESGLRLLREAATPGAATESDALLLLMIIDHRDGRPADARERLVFLQRKHPKNRLLLLNHGASALAAQHPEEADQVLSKGIADARWEAPPAVLGETALWFAHRGRARARLHRPAEARSDLERGLAANPRDWVRGRIHGELGDLALIAGDRAGAEKQFEAALNFCARGGDRSEVDDAKRKLSALRH